MKRTIRIGINVLTVIILLLSLTIIIPRIFGIGARAVLSGSMSPAISTGSLVYVKPTDQSNITVGDIITYVMSNETVSTHRVVAVNADGSFTVKGDANSDPDGMPVTYQNVLGVVKFHIPVIGYALGFVSTWTGRIIVITLIIALLMLLVLLKDDDEEEGADPAPAMAFAGGGMQQMQQIQPMQQAEPQGVMNMSIFDKKGSQGQQYQQQSFNPNSAQMPMQNQGMFQSSGQMVVRHQYDPKNRYRARYSQSMMGGGI